MVEGPDRSKANGPTSGQPPSILSLDPAGNPSWGGPDEKRHDPVGHDRKKPIPVVEAGQAEETAAEASELDPKDIKFRVVAQQAPLHQREMLPS